MVSIERFFKSIKLLVFNENGTITFFGKFFVSILIAVLAFNIVKIFDNIIYKKFFNEKLSRNNARMRTAATVTNSIIKVFVYIFALLLILDFMGINTKSILAVAGIGGLTIAFAAQSIVKDIINGSFLLFENQFDVGDWVEIKGKSGTVIDIGVRTTKLQDFAGQIHMIPNGEIDIVTNFSKNNMKAVVDVTLRSYLDVNQAITFIDEAIAKIDTIFEDNPRVLGIVNMDVFSYTVRIVAMVRPGSQWEAERIIRKNVLSIFQENNLIKTIIVKK